MIWPFRAEILQIFSCDSGSNENFHKSFRNKLAFNTMQKTKNNMLKQMNIEEAMAQTSPELIFYVIIMSQDSSVYRSVIRGESNQWQSTLKTIKSLNLGKTYVLIHLRKKLIHIFITKLLNTEYHFSLVLAKMKSTLISKFIILSFNIFIQLPPIKSMSGT